MDYDYDHLADGIDDTLQALSAKIREVEDRLESDGYDYVNIPDFMKQGYDLDELVRKIPESGSVSDVERVVKAEEAVTMIQNVDGRFMSSIEAQAMASILQSAIYEEKHALETYCGIQFK